MFPKKIRLTGLNPNYIYAVEGTEIVAGGDELMYSGIDTAGTAGDFSSKSWTLKAIKSTEKNKYVLIEEKV